MPLGVPLLRHGLFLPCRDLPLPVLRKAWPATRLPFLCCRVHSPQRRRLLPCRERPYSTLRKALTGDEKSLSGRDLPALQHSPYFSRYGVPWPRPGNRPRFVRAWARDGVLRRAAAGVAERGAGVRERRADVPSA